MSEDVFGLPIDKSNADVLFENFIRIRARTAPLLQKALGSDKEALRYYCGKPDSNPMLEDWAFVFDKAAMEHVMKKLYTGEADCVFMFNGADAGGKPTLMLFPAKYTEAEEAIAESSMALNQTSKKTIAAPINEFRLFAKGKDGVQHPGTGGGELATINAKKIKLPIGFKKGQYRS